MQEQAYYEFACLKTGEIKKFTSWTDFSQIKIFLVKGCSLVLTSLFFTCTDIDAIKEVSAKLKEKDCGYLLVLQSYIDYKGRLIYKKQPLTSTGIMKILNIKQTTFSCFINEMHKHNIILKDENGYKVNQKYHWTDPAKVIISLKPIKMLFGICIEPTTHVILVLYINSFPLYIRRQIFYVITLMNRIRQQ